MIDDGVETELAIQFNSLKSFIHEQPATTRIGLAYLRNGSANIVAPLTTDREKVAKALRVPLGEAGISSSPYLGISDLVKKWPGADARREVLLISSGIDPLLPPDPQNPYLRKPSRTRSAREFWCTRFTTPRRAMRGIAYRALIGQLPLGTGR